MTNQLNWVQSSAIIKTRAFFLHKVGSCSAENVAQDVDSGRYEKDKI